MPSPVAAHWSRDPLQYAAHVRDPVQRCEFCVHGIFIRPRADGRPGYSLR